ncbi:ribonuclease G [bacterium]|nr:ribonuclease G [bacterium]
MENKICNYCKAQIPSDAIKCQYCGEWQNSGNDNLPYELKRFNWGAFLLNWIWGVTNKKYITLLYFPACIIPVIGPLAISIWFGIAGNKWAWEAKPWQNIEEFNEAQKFWVRLWFILAGISLIIAIKIFVILAIIGSIEL